MSKVLILGDLHIGVRNSSSIFLNQTKDFLYNTLYPYIKNTTKIIVNFFFIFSPT